MNWQGRWARHHLLALVRPGELRVLGLALLSAVAAASAVQLFSDRVGRAIAAQTGETLGADLIISSRTPLEAALRQNWEALALRQTEVIQLPSVIWHGDKSQLAGLKAVQEAYPLKGHLRTAPAPLQAEQRTTAVPPPGEAWADAQLWSALALKPGDSVELGAARLRITRLLSYEPDRGTGYVDIAPRLLINQADLAATELLQPGSRAQYRVLLAGPADLLEKVRKIELPPGVKLLSPRDARPEIRSAIERAESFLALAAMTASLLGAVAIALCAHQYGQRLQADVALLRCLGARRPAIIQALLLSLLVIALVAGGSGALLGLGAQAALAGAAEILQLPSLPPPRASALLQAWLMAAMLLAGFALPPLLGATRASPLQVFQARPGQRGRAPWRLAALLGLIGILALQTRDWKLLAYVGAGQFLTAALLALLTWLMLLALRGVRGQGLRGWRLGLGNLLRRPALSLAQSVALGLGLLALLLLTVVRNDLLQGWQDKLPADTPNQFLINIQQDQLVPLRDFLAERGISAQRIWPMTRARLVGINGQTVRSEDFADPETQRWINRDFNLSWAEELGSDNRLVEGPWWGAAGQGQPWLSADTYARERLQLKLGDKLQLDFAGEKRTFIVRNFREVDWESFQPNFFLLCPPGIIEDMPATWLTSFYLPDELRPELRSLSRRFPNITVLDLQAMMQQVRQIMQRIVGALEVVFAFTLAAGFTVLLAAMETGRAERAREMALMRTLGASKREIRAALLAEFAGLGLLSGLVAAFSSQLVGWVLATWVFKFPYHWNALVMVTGALGGAALVCALAWLSLRQVVNTPPDRVLRQ